jgi:uncharacterized protein with HEPN domain
MVVGVRDKLIYNLMGVNFTIVWDVIKNKTPDMHKQISEFLNREEKLCTIN